MRPRNQGKIPLQPLKNQLFPREITPFSSLSGLAQKLFQEPPAQTGIGDWVLSWANTFTGATTINGGGTLVWTSPLGQFQALEYENR